MYCSSLPKFVPHCKTWLCLSKRNSFLTQPNRYSLHNFHSRYIPILQPSLLDPTSRLRQSNSTRRLFHPISTSPQVSAYTPTSYPKTLRTYEIAIYDRGKIFHTHPFSLYVSAGCLVTRRVHQGVKCGYVYKPRSAIS
jgi:hypothetical protein